MGSFAAKARNHGWCVWKRSLSGGRIREVLALTLESQSKPNRESTNAKIYSRSIAGSVSRLTGTKTTISLTVTALCEFRGGSASLDVRGRTIAAACEEARHVGFGSSVQARRIKSRHLLALLRLHSFGHLLLFTNQTRISALVVSSIREVRRLPRRTTQAI